MITEIQGPFWALLLVMMGLFSSYEKASARIRKLFKKREILFIGRCQVKPPERDTFIYGNRRIKDDNLDHEVALSLMLAPLYRFARIFRLYDVDEELRPDATTIIGGKVYHWEYHIGSEGLVQVKERMKCYEDRIKAKPDEEFILLIVCKKPSQFPKMRKATEALKDITYFASLQDVVTMKTPWDRVWQPQDWKEGNEKNRIKPPGQQTGQELG